MMAEKPLEYFVERLRARGVVAQPLMFNDARSRVECVALSCLKRSSEVPQMYDKNLLSALY